jgi:hypothetical protein
MIGMGAKSITIVRAVTADFFFDCRAAEVPSEGSKAWTVFVCPNSGVVGSEPTRGIDILVCVSLSSCFLCAGSCLGMTWCHVQRTLPELYRIKKFKMSPRPNKGALNPSITIINKETNSVVWVSERTIPTERPQLVGEVRDKFCG